MQFATQENVYKCDGCKAKIKETDLIGVKNRAGYYELVCSCGSKNLNVVKQRPNQLFWI